jgi:hypothetical protein
MQSAAFQGGASCIKDSAAFSFDEPQHLQTSPLNRGWYIIRSPEVWTRISC